MGAVIVKGGCVLSLSKRVGNLHEADVLIEDDRIVEVGPNLRTRNAEVIDATDTIVMPGFVDTHRHLWRTLLRNLGAQDPAEALTRFGPRHTPEDVYAATLLGLLGAIESGITTVVDWSDIQVDAATTEAALQAHADAGVRTVFAPAPPAWDQQAEGGAAILRKLIADDGPALPATTILAFAAPDLVRAGGQDPAATWAAARALGLRIHAHAGLDADDRGVAAEVDRQGTLGDDLTLVHGTYLGDDDLDAVKERGVALALTPASEMATGLGTPPIQALIDRGIRPGLGVEDQLIAPGDVFAQMRSVQSLQHGASFELKLAGKSRVPALLGTRDVIRYATIDGARVAGVGEVTGCLEPGRQADLILLRTDRPNIAPVNDPIGAVVWGMDASNLDTVLIAGRVRMREGVLDADVAWVRGLALQASERLGTGGHLVGSGEGGVR